ncbi:MAG: hypothetical protein AAB573_03375 [Patescibacteria group bacterium]
MAEAIEEYESAVQLARKAAQKLAKKYPSHELLTVAGEEVQRRFGGEKVSASLRDDPLLVKAATWYNWANALDKAADKAAED